MIYYFSATGNTRWAAEQLAALLDEPLMAMGPQGSVDLASQGSVDLSSLDADRDVLGFCFPVHGWRLPKRVKDFLSHCNANREKRPYIFVVMTCGDDCAQTIRYYNEVAEPRGLKADAVFSLKMPESYVGLPFMDVDKKEREREKIETAAMEIQRIASLIRSRARNIYNVHEGACPWLKSKLIGGFFHSVLVTDKRFKLDDEKCIGCGKCVKVCPVGNMRLGKDSKPEWLHTGECMTCLACYHFCPSHAIVFNNQTRKKGQYFFKER